jgi:hypothetical protein
MISFQVHAAPVISAAGEGETGKDNCNAGHEAKASLYIRPEEE